ncbi:DUF397 domain-containing protein [Streptosporangium sp. NPDC004379]|uniref:DUF397 domain-containing protein n=1 Tax=Streptosporangium sp. NPDC004379 TaxID=3366189 RepID=UPI0036AEAD4D
MDHVTCEPSNVRWRKSSLSGDDGSNCVEIATLAGGRRAVRDSKDRTGPTLTLTPAQWTAFADALRTDALG